MSGKKLTLSDLKKKLFKFEKSSNSASNWPKFEITEFAFIGRSNVGKSTLINGLTMQHGLAKTSKTPGRTQMINFFNLNDIVRLVDLPGYGYAKAEKSQISKWEDFTLEYLLHRPQLKMLFILLDGRHGIKANDFDMINFCATNNINYQIVLTKADKTKTKDLENLQKLILQNLKSELGYNHDVIFTSSLKNIGFDDIRSKIINNL